MTSLIVMTTPRACIHVTSAKKTRFDSSDHNQAWVPWSARGHGSPTSASFLFRNKNSSEVGAETWGVAGLWVSYELSRLGRVTATGNFKVLDRPGLGGMHMSWSTICRPAAVRVLVQPGFFYDFLPAANASMRKFHSLSPAEVSGGAAYFGPFARLSRRNEISCTRSRLSLHFCSTR